MPIYSCENSNSGSDKVRAHIRLTGRVQGVAFRYYARNMAHHFGVNGWIRNMENGDVEVMIEGREKVVKQMITWCKKGPSLAMVENVEINWQPYTGEFHEFYVRS